MNRQSDKITALYCRVDRGGDSSHAMDVIRMQKEILIQYATDNDLPNPCVFADCGFSGTTPDRPEFQRMLREIEAGHVSALVVHSITRLTRSIYDCATLIEETLPKNGVAFHSVKDNLYLPMKPLFAALAAQRGGGRNG